MIIILIYKSFQNFIVIKKRNKKTKYAVYQDELSPFISLFKKKKKLLTMDIWLIHMSIVILWAIFLVHNLNYFFFIWFYFTYTLIKINLLFCPIFYKTCFHHLTKEKTFMINKKKQIFFHLLCSTLLRLFKFFSHILYLLLTRRWAGRNLCNAIHTKYIYWINS